MTTDQTSEANEEEPVGDFVIGENLRRGVPTRIEDRVVLALVDRTPTVYKWTVKRDEKPKR